MSREEALLQLAGECPRRILGALHARGHYVQVTCPRSPGKVLCLRHDTPLPEGAAPTPAQAALCQPSDREGAAAHA